MMMSSFMRVARRELVTDAAEGRFQSLQIRQVDTTDAVNLMTSGLTIEARNSSVMRLHCSGTIECVASAMHALESEDSGS